MARGYGLRQVLQRKGCELASAVRESTRGLLGVVPLSSNRQDVGIDVDHHVELQCKASTMASAPSFFSLNVMMGLSAARRRGDLPTSSSGSDPSSSSTSSRSGAAGPTPCAPAGGGSLVITLLCRQPRGATWSAAIRSRRHSRVQIGLEPPRDLVVARCIGWRRCQRGGAHRSKRWPRPGILVARAQSASRAARKGARSRGFRQRGAINRGSVRR